MDKPAWLGVPPERVTGNGELGIEREMRGRGRGESELEFFRGERGGWGCSYPRGAMDGRHVAGDGHGRGMAATPPPCLL